MLATVVHENMKLEDENMKMVKFIMSATLNRAPTLGRLIE